MAMADSPRQSDSPTPAQTPVHASTDDLDLLLEVMPPAIREALEDHPERGRLIEIVLDLGRVPEARFPGGTVDLSMGGRSAPGSAPRPVSATDLGWVVQRIGSFGADNRAGIERTLHRISALRNRQGEVVGLTCRVGRSVVGTVDILRDVIEAGSSILLLGRPGVGKTTLLRESARVLADDLGKRVVVVDTSNEIAGDGDIPHPGIGRARRMQVPTPEAQHRVMIEAVENHMPEVIVIDEIGTAAEALAARTIAERGVQLIATAHGNSLDNLLQNPTLADLVGGVQVVTLSDEEARRRDTRKTVLERKAPPTFDVVVEIRDRDHLALHRGVAQVVDDLLAGYDRPPEERRREADGEVVIEAPEPPDEPAGGPWSPVTSAPWDRARGARRSGSGRGAARGPAARGGAGRGAAGRGATGPGARRRRVLRIFPYAVSRERLDRAIRHLQVPARLVEDLREADLILTVKSQERRQPKRLREAQLRGTPLEVLRSNTSRQMETFLEGWFEPLRGPAATSSPEADAALSTLSRQGAERAQEAALREAQEAIDRVLENAEPVELQPRDAPVRRLQHELVEEAGLASDSRGREPRRRVVVRPG